MVVGVSGACNPIYRDNRIVMQTTARKLIDFSVNKVHAEKGLLLCSSFILIGTKSALSIFSGTFETGYKPGLCCKL